MSATTSHNLYCFLLCCPSVTIGSRSIVLDASFPQSTDTLSHNIRFKLKMSPFRDQMKINDLNVRRELLPYSGTGRQLRASCLARGIFARRRAAPDRDCDFRAAGHLSIHQCHGWMKTGPMKSLLSMLAIAEPANHPYVAFVASGEPEMDAKRTAVRCQVPHKRSRDISSSRIQLSVH
jgi:hypothetical protein